MAKTVLANAMVAHVWAQQSQSEGRSHNGNFSFRGSRLFSYRTMIAQAVTGKRGNVFLITCKKYSMTTEGKHKNKIWRALASDQKQFVCPFIGSDYIEGMTAREHVGNLDYFRARFAERVAHIKRMRDEPWFNVSDDLAEYAAVYSEYCAAFGFKRKPLDYATQAAEVIAYRKERDAKRNTPQAIKARERARERKAEKVRADYRSGKSTYSYYSREYRRIEALMNDDDRAARAVAIIVANADKIAAWYAGEVNGFRFDADCGGAALRVRGDLLETSQGASVPLDHAKRAFRFLKLVRERGQGWHCNGRTLRVGHFAITEVEPDGSFRAGCHYIKWPEIERAAIAANVFDVEPTDTTEAS